MSIPFALSFTVALLEITTSKHRRAEEAGLEYSCSPAEWLSAWKVDDWNRARVRVEGKYAKITTWINDVKVCSFDGSSSKASQYDKDKVSDTLGAKGRIAVQVHGGTGWPKGMKCQWKDIRIRSLNR